MKKEIRIEGNAFSKRRRIIQRTESPDEMSDGMREISRFTKDPWEAQRPLIEWATAALAQEQAEHAPDHQFKPHEDAGWYLSEIITFAKIVDFNIAKGDSRWSAFAGARFGELWSEFQLQMARGELYCQAIAIRESCSEAGKKRSHPSTAEERVEAVRRHLGTHPSLKRAYSRAAVNLAAKYRKPIAARTVRRAWEDAQES